MFKKIQHIGLFLMLIASTQVKAEEQSITTNSATATVVLGVTEVSLIKSSSTIINLQLKQREAGESIESSTSDSTARLLISSVISTANPRTLTAKVSSGSVPNGTLLELVAMIPNPNFVGMPGTLATKVSLDETDKLFVTNIETCYSGTGGLSDGYPLKFTYSLNSNTATYGSLRATSGTQIIVTFTLSAAL